MDQEWSKVMIVVESLIEFVSRKDKFKSFKPKEKGNGRGDKEGHVENSSGNDDNEKP